LALPLAAGVDLFLSLRSVGRAAGQVTHTYQVLAHADALLGDLRDAETGQRGFLLTGEPSYLRPYEAGRAQAAAALVALSQAVADNPTQRGRLPEIVSLTSGKLAELERTVALARSGDEEGAIEIVRTGEGMALMNRLRLELAGFAAEEQRLLGERRATLDTNERHGIVRALAMALGGALAALVGAIMLFRRGHRTEAQLVTATSKIRAQAALLKQTYDTAPVGLSLLDADLRHIAINERLAAINGRSVEDHIGKTTAEVAPQFGPAVEPIFQQVLQTGDPVIDIDLCMPGSTAAPAPRDYLGSCWPVKDADGYVTGVNVAILDVTERRAVERRLAESEARLRAVYDAVPVGIVTAEMPSGRITGGNAQVEAVTGHPVKMSEGVGDYGEWVSYHADGRRVQAHEYPMARMIHDGLEAAEAEVLWERGAERRWVRIYGRAIKSNDGRSLGGVVALIDIDDLKRAEERLAQQVALRTAELQTANEQLEAFAYTVSHDLRAPLRGMEGFARILLEDFTEALGSKGAHYAERIVAAAERMEGLIDDLLTYSRIQRAEMTLCAFDPTPIARAAAEDAKATTPTAMIEVQQLPAVVAEPTMLGHILGNLLTNAVKFHKPGASPCVRVRAEQRQDRVRLWVEDDGIGVAPEHQERIFNAFERLHGQEAYSGTGIGLAIVRAGAQRLGGDVGVVSEAGQGARFWLELPAASVETALTAEDADLEGIDHA
jgi:PAS domain S-box-containing protein